MSAAWPACRPGNGALENEIDKIAGTGKWITGNADTLPALQAEGWDLQSHYDKNLRLLSPTANFFEAGMVAQWLQAGVPADSGYGCRALTTAVAHHDLATAQLLATAHAPFVLESGERQVRPGLRCLGRRGGTGRCRWRRPGSWDAVRMWTSMTVREPRF